MLQYYYQYQDQQSITKIMRNSSNSNDEYGYDFSYSVAFDQMPVPHQQQQTQTQFNNNLHNEFMQWCDLFVAINVLKDIAEQGAISCSILLRTAVFRKLGISLLQFCKVKYSDVSLQEKSNQNQKIRDKIYNSMQELEKIAGKDKQKYLNTIIACFYAIIQRAIQELNLINSNLSSKSKSNYNEEFELFHIIYWEIKGQLVSKQNMENILMKTFNVDQFHKFMYSTKDQLKLKIKKAAILHEVQPQLQALTFRSSFANRDKNKTNNNEMYQSFKDVMINKTNQNNIDYYKQNKSNNQPANFELYLNRKQDNCRSPARVHMQNFKKKPQQYVPLLKGGLLRKHTPVQFAVETINTTNYTHKTNNNEQQYANFLSFRNRTDRINSISPKYRHPQ